MRRLLSVCLAIGVAVGATVAFPRSHASAQVGPCAGSTGNYVSIFCDKSSTAWSGIYAVWPSVVLNISQTWAQQGMHINEAAWLYDQNLHWLELGDTGGGAGIVGHTNEWARMWYWTDGTGAQEIDNFYNYSPADNANRSYGIQWDAPANGWDVCFNGACQYLVTTWTNPSNFTWTEAATGLEVGVTGGATLDSNTNSGNFLVTQNQLRTLGGGWVAYPTAATQVDSQCGTAPTCLQGWWSSPPPPYTSWNNGKPAQ